MRSLSFVLFVALAIPALSSAHAGASGVGLGVAGGVAYSGSKIDDAAQLKQEVIGARFAWGFFVDIPLLSTFYITPSTMLYDLGPDGAKRAVTDVDLNFKFIVPVSRLSFGGGVTAGLSTGLEEAYVPHYGLLGFASVNVVSNLDAFVLVQYKRMVPEHLSRIDDIHGFLGGMFHF